MANDQGRKAPCVLHFYKNFVALLNLVYIFAVSVQFPGHVPPCQDAKDGNSCILGGWMRWSSGTHSTYDSLEDQDCSINMHLEPVLFLYAQVAHVNQGISHQLQGTSCVSPLNDDFTTVIHNLVFFRLGYYNELEMCLEATADSKISWWDYYKHQCIIQGSSDFQYLVRSASAGI